VRRFWRTGIAAGLFLIGIASPAPAENTGAPPSGSGAPGATNPVKPTAVADGASAPLIRLFMKDGQLKSSPVEIFVTKDIPPGIVPKLTLVAGHAVSGKLDGSFPRISSGRAAPLPMVRTRFTMGRSFFST
jgi:hypothetical protein